MNWIKRLALLATMWTMSGVAAAAALPASAAPDAAQIKAAHELLVAMQSEKMLKLTASTSHYADPRERQAVLDKLNKVPPEEIYRRLSAPIARILTPETVAEMTRFYQSSYGQRVLKETYNSGPSLYPTDPVPTAAEKPALKQPAYLKAQRAFQEAEIGRAHV